MKHTNTLCATILFACWLLSSVHGRGHLDIALRPENDTSTPSVVTIPNGDVTFTPDFQSTAFPIGSTTNHTGEPTHSTSSTTPTPTTPKAHSTTTHSTTTHHSSVTTTPRPTTTSPGTSTVPVPTLPPEPAAPSAPWNLTYDDKGNNCIMISFAGRLEISYNNVDNQAVQTGLDVPVNATVDTKKSLCKPGDDKQVLVLDLKSASVPEASLKLTFERHPTDANDSSLYAVELSVRITEDLFLGINDSYIGKTVVLSVSNLTLFDTEPKQSFSCNSLIKTSLTDVKVDKQHSSRAVYEAKSPFQNGTLETSSLKLQAFLPSDEKTDSFYPNNACKQDQGDISSAIPLTVGIILLVMVGVVLVAYFIGRSRQTQQESYSDM